MTVNLHTHTFRCGHATGTDEEYVLRAIENGIKVMGFSEHVPYIFPGGTEICSHMPISLTADYIDSINRLREKYKDRIDIHIGFEMEYYPRYFDDMYKTVKAFGAEYLLLAQHYVGREEPFGHWVGQVLRPMEELTEYVDLLTEGIKTGVFTYVCHPDIINATSDMDMYRAEMTRLCKTAKQYGVPLEINFYGIRDHRFYPFEEFWKIAGEVGCKVAYGFDSHDAISAFDGDSISEADRLVNEYGLILEERPQIVRLP